jgi:hypothetical protein
LHSQLIERGVMNGVSKAKGILTDALVCFIAIL